MRGGVVAGGLLAVLAGLAGCSDDGGTGARPSASPSGPASATSPTAPGTSSTPSSTPSGATSSATSSDGAAPAGPPKVVDTVATGLDAPWGLAFLPGGDAVVTERDTRRVLRIDGRDHTVRQVGTVDQAVSVGDQGGEAGLLGVAVSPTYPADRLLYFYLSTDSDNRVVRGRLAGGRLGPLTVVLDGIPNGFIHDGGRLAFGPDGYLYVSTGEGGEPERAPDRSSLGGKILRITPTGSPAPGNPFPGSPVWSYGHRNVQGLAFDGSRLWASEFGQDTFDELNRIRAGGNYGWPTVEGTGGEDRGFVDPQQQWSTDDASPSGLAYLGGHLWMGALKGERLWRITVDGDRSSSPRAFFVGRYGRMRTVVAAPDGRLWVTTSNTDGRGEPARADDRILVVEP